ncbi:hypothetical protein [Desulfomicrobium baculatum]|uniref:HAMP domain-containing histidine kinase n=1 Tax=Desulfomicrobium baculatum (strain DSM 4028 / VKM B-1378 / X) TaxID=525897 RepID=C7LQF0_DESBD|nr:hypothetical protein [Desulfomicrobium baculatum]ACU90352.1 conserved hypothetical protein [Desulfomicrobium baculatum DSM 4028]
MPEIPKEARFMGTVTAQTMHEMQNILAIIRESAGLMGDILKVNSRVDFKHKPNMERTLENITFQVDRGKGLLDATSRLAHTPDADLLEGCDLTAYSKTLVQLADRYVRLKGTALNFSAPSTALPVSMGALQVLMSGYRALQWAVGAGMKDGVMRVDLEGGTDFHVLTICPPEGVTPDREGIAALGTMLEPGRVEWDGSRLQLFFPVQR